MGQKLTGKITKILYEGSDGFFIAVLDSGIKIKGHYLESDIKHLKGSQVTLEGEWEEHKEYGRSFNAHFIQINHNELFFFLTKILKGFTKKIAADLIEHFSPEGLVEILENDIQKLMEFEGIKEKRLKKIQESWKKYRSMRRLGEFLAPFNVTPTLLTTIAKALKDVDEPCVKIKNNPYILTNIKGIGFKTADELALKMGVDPKDSNRLQNAMEYILMEYCESEGNSCVSKEILFSKLDELLGFSNQTQLYESILVEMVALEEIIPLGAFYAPKRLYEAEKYLYEEFKRRSKIKNEPLVKNLPLFLEEHPLRLGEQQQKAIEIINNGAGVLFLVGYAGTGKSTTAKTLLDLLNMRYSKEEIFTCALSGIASQRIADTTGYASSTIQSLLGRFEEKDHFSYKVLLIDEASMINSWLFYKVVSKVDPNAILIIVGDDAQLPPIGAGNVLSDMITFSFLPLVKLTKIYRQSEDQAITLIANEIRQAKVPAYKERYEDFFFIDHSIKNYYALKNSLSQKELQEIREQNHTNIIASILELVLEHIQKARYRLQNKQIKEYLNYFQVITPMKGGTLGVHNLNKILQEYFNPNPKKCFKRGEVEFRLMDKVVHIKNENMPSWSAVEFKEGEESSKRRIYNGMNGLVFQIDEEEEVLFVYYPNEDSVVQYEFDEAKEYLELSYALTIHKVQGMEYDIVVIPMSFSHYVMLSSKLIYTAITRAKHKCYVIGESGAFEMGCKRLEKNKRETVLLQLGRNDEKNI